MTLESPIDAANETFVLESEFEITNRLRASLVAIAKKMSPSFKFDFIQQADVLEEYIALNSVSMEKTTSVNPQFEPSILLVFHSACQADKWRTLGTSACTLS